MTTLIIILVFIAMIWSWGRGSDVVRGIVWFDDDTKNVIEIVYVSITALVILVSFFL